MNTKGKVGLCVRVATIGHLHYLQNKKGAADLQQQNPAPLSFFLCLVPVALVAGILVKFRKGISNQIAKALRTFLNGF